MKKYEELYNHSKYVFDEEVTRFSRIEDKAARFITVVTSLLAVYALTGRELFGDLISTETCSNKLLIILASMVLLGLLTSWGFAFQALHIQGMKKAPLNEELLSFYNNNKLINIYFSMSKKFSDSLKYNRSITDLKAKNIKRSFWCIVFTVVVFTLFIILSALNANSTVTEMGPNKTVNNKQIDKKGSIVKEYKLKSKEEHQMIDNDTDTNPDSEPENPTTTTSDKPDLDIVAPDFDIVTESFDPSKLPKGEEPKE